MWSNIYSGETVSCIQCWYPML